MSKFLRLIAWSVLLMLCSNGICAQDGTNKRILSIDEIFNLVEQNNSALQSCKIAAKATEAIVSETKAKLLPDINASLSLSYLGDGYLTNRDFSNGTNIDIPHWGNNLVLKASQAIYTGGALTSQIKLSKLGHQLANQQIDETRNNVRFMTVSYYLQLAMLDNQLSVYNANIALTENVIQQMQARRKEGIILQNDITRYELQLESQKLQRTRIIDNKKIINHQLITATGLPAETIIVPDTSILSELPKIMAEDDWQNIADIHSPAIKMSHLNIDLKKTEERLAKSDRLPKVSLFAENHFDGPITIEVPTLNNNFNYWFVGINVSYNISSLFKSNKKIKQTMLATRKAQEDLTHTQEIVENNVQAAYTNFLTSFTDLNTHKKSVELANQNYKIINNRYNNGLALVTDMTDAATQLLNAELQLVNARINVIFNYYKLKSTSGNL